MRPVMIREHWQTHQQWHTRYNRRQEIDAIHQAQQNTEKLVLFLYQIHYQVFYLFLAGAGEH